MQDTITTRDKAILRARSVLSYLPKVGLKKKPNYHPYGVSFLVAVKDEERWIKPCIQSIQNVADEIIVVDSSVKDKTTQIVAELAQNNNKIKHMRFYWGAPNAFALSLHAGLVSVNYRWVFKWDSDLIAKSPEVIQEWIDRLKTLDKNRYYVIDVARINLEGDLHHQSKVTPFAGYEGRIFTWSPDLRWGLKAGTCEQPSGDTIWGHRFPFWFTNLRWHEPYIFHCNIKDPKRTLTRMFWGDFMAKNETQFATLDEYTEYRVKKDWNMTMEQAIEKAAQAVQKSIVPLDTQRFGELPTLLRDA